MRINELREEYKISKNINISIYDVLDSISVDRCININSVANNLKIDIDIALIGINKSMINITFNLNDRGNSNNIFNLNVKVITFDKSKVTIIPNLMAFNSTNTLNHKVSIGSITQEELELIKSKGLNIEDYKKILTNF